MPSTRRPLNQFEVIVLGHLGIFMLGGTWLLGGNPEWVRIVLSWWGTLAPLIALGAVLDRDQRKLIDLRTFLWLWPFVLLNGLVLLSCLHPSFREMRYGDNVILVPVPLPAWPPNTAEPGVSLHALWLFDGLYLTGFNLVLLIQQRRALRGFLIACVANALILAIFGTIQRLVGSKGLFFGLVPSPRQPFFFASFIYHNHWGAFAIEMSAVCLGLAWRSRNMGGFRSFFRTPGFLMLVAALFLAATEPVSASRSGTLLLLPLWAGAGLHWFFRLVRRRRRFNESVKGPILATSALAVLVAGGIWYIASDIIQARLATTREQVAEMAAAGSRDSRAVLYHDTWRMARDKLWFGWGMGSYPRAFIQYNSQRISPVDGLVVDYYQAHSDWLQSAAEHGLAGTALLGLCALVPLSRVPRRWLGGVLPLYLLGGCAIIALYAWVEFPFDNTGVVLVWWTCFFSALQYGRLSEKVARAPRNRT
jgi:hypothetical protein